MAIVPVTLGTRSNPGRDSSISAAHLVNCYVEDAGPEGKTQWPILACDGLAEFAQLTAASRIKAALSLDSSTAYVVAGLLVHKVTSAGVVTDIGGFSTGDLAFMARNRRAIPQIAIVSGGLYYLIENDVLTQISDADLPTPNSVASFGGYFVFTIADGRFFLSSLEQGNAIAATDYATAEAGPDGLLCGATRGSDLVLFGSRTIEFWILNPNPADGDFALQRNAVTSIGCHAAGSVSEVTVVSASGEAIDSVAWAATDAQGSYVGVMLLTGYAGTKISTHAVDRDILSETNTDNIRSFTWSRGGHTFYAITGTDWTWVYDTVTQRWHERTSYDETNWRVSVTFAFGSTIIAGDRSTGQLYTMSSAYNDEAGDPLIMTVQPPAVHAYPHRMCFHSVRIDTIPGTGINSTTEAVADPRLMVAHSNDNGKTWFAERHAPAGKIGEFKKRIRLNRFGDSGEDGKVFRISASAAVVKGLIGMAVDVTQLEA